MSVPHHDQNMLFGILAARLDFVSQDQLLAGMNQWIENKSAPLGDILCQQQSLSKDHRVLLEQMVVAHLELHGGDSEKSLATLDLPQHVRESLAMSNDTEVDATLSIVGNATRADHEFTVNAMGVTSDNQRFHILRPHAKGGLGAVSVAKDIELNREVALKEIQKKFADDQNQRARFIQEAETTGGLEHPGIVPV